MVVSIKQMNELEQASLGLSIYKARPVSLLQIDSARIISRVGQSIGSGKRPSTSRPHSPALGWSEKEFLEILYIFLKIFFLPHLLVFEICAKHYICWIVSPKLQPNPSSTSAIHAATVGGYASPL